MKKLISLLTCITLSILIFIGCSCSATPPAQINAVWWWNDEFDKSTTTTYLNYAKQNGINQIYYCSSKFNNQTANFIKQANSLGIDVFWLDGNYKWLHSLEKEQKLHNKILNYINYNSAYPDAKFAGVHLDIEPHQSKNADGTTGENLLADELNFETETGRQNLITNLVTLANKLNTTYPNINFAYDIPFWLHDEITFNQITKPAYKHLIDVASNIVVMSYRDNAQAIYDVAKQELEYAESINKTITLSVECGSEEDIVTFKEEGKQILSQELEALKTLVPKNTGMCFHNIKTWYELKD